MAERMLTTRMVEIRVAKIATTIGALVDAYKEVYGVDKEQINAGWCFEFAADLKELLPEAECLDNETLAGKAEWTHAFVKIGRMFYDSQTPYGVANWRLLPCCKECLEFYADDDDPPTGEAAA